MTTNYGEFSQQPQQEISQTHEIKIGDKFVFTKDHNNGLNENSVKIPKNTEVKISDDVFGDGIYLEVKRTDNQNFKVSNGDTVLLQFIDIETLLEYAIPITESESPNSKNLKARE